jgi:hypothetical protein
VSNRRIQRLKAVESFFARTDGMVLSVADSERFLDAAAVAHVEPEARGDGESDGGDVGDDGGSDTHWALPPRRIPAFVIVRPERLIDAMKAGVCVCLRRGAIAILCSHFEVRSDALAVLRCQSSPQW